MGQEDPDVERVKESPLPIFSLEVKVVSFITLAQPDTSVSWELRSHITEMSHSQSLKQDDSVSALRWGHATQWQGMIESRPEDVHDAHRSPPMPSTL